jgi:hypothetical protein
MTRTPEQTDRALARLHRHYEAPQHIAATPEETALLRSLVGVLCDRCAELEQLAADLYEAGCADMAYHVWTLHCDVTTHLDGTDGPGADARRRVEGILDGTYETD